MIERIKKHRLVDTIILVVLLIAGSGQAESQLEFPGPAPGPAQGGISRGELVLENKVLACTWDIDTFS